MYYVVDGSKARVILQVLVTPSEVLDIGCGPGGWVQRAAQDSPRMHVTGIDLSATMIAYAQARAGVMRLGNAYFRVIDATGPLDFPDASFDLVNALLISGFLLPQQWVPLLAECRRLLRPGGIARLTEGEWGVVTAADLATARLFGLGLDALHHAGHRGSSRILRCWRTTLAPSYTC